MQHAPVLKDLVLVGGGHAHVHVLKRFGMAPLGGVRLTLVTRDTETPYSGMLPGLVAGTYTRDESHIDLRRLAHFASARLIHGEAIGLDRAARMVLCAGRPPIRYDVLSLDTGAGPTLAIPGAVENGVPVKPVDVLLDRWNAIVETTQRTGRTPRIVIVGGGAGGVELALAIAHRLRSLTAGKPSGESPSLMLVTRHDILPRFPVRGREILRTELQERGIAVVTGADVVEARPDALICSGGNAIPFDKAIWVTGASAPRWLGDTGLMLDAKGFVALEPTLRSINDPHVFAAGDVASVLEHPRPSAGVFAVRQGKPLAANLRRALLGKPLRPFTPQSKFLVVVGTADNKAVATRGDWAALGAWAWRLKQWIDRRWIRGYQILPVMDEARPARKAVSSPTDIPAMRCNGCGGKVPSAALHRALGRLRQAGHKLDSIDTRDDAAILRPEPDRLLLQSVDFFREFVSDPHVFGRIAANHALGDIYAMGGTPIAALAIAGVPPAASAIVEDDLFQMLGGGIAVLEEAGACLAGCHSAETETLSLGFSVTGTARPDRIMRKGRLKPGDRLILTKPLGIGTLFAAEMQGRAKARWLDAAIAIMLVPSGDAARCFVEYGASACTDVTGFGLLGHLIEMLDASTVSAALDLEALPILEGALELLAEGVGSSLHPENETSGDALDDGDFTNIPRAILFDPQAAGGLLAGIPAERADACLATLRRGGYGRAAIIGTVSERGRRAVRLEQLSFPIPSQEP